LLYLYFTYGTPFPYEMMIIVMCIHLVTCRYVHLFSAQTLSKYNQRLPNKTIDLVVPTKNTSKETNERID